MSLDQLASIASIIASGAVVVSLVFIGAQLRQNAHLTRMAAAQTSAMLLSENYGRVVEQGDLAELLVKSRQQGIDTLTPAQRLRVSNFLSISFRHYEVLHTHRRYDIFEQELWEGSEARLRESLSSSAVRVWWADTKDYYARSFAKYVDVICSECEATQQATD